MARRLEVRGLAAGYGASDVLHGVDLHVDDGEVVAMLGPNGCGKSTVLKAIAGIADVTAGSVLLDGDDVTGWSTARRVAEGLGYVPQVRNVFPSLTVAENLRMGTFAGGGDIDAVVRLFPVLQDLSARRASTLSGGQRQVVALARALAGRPKVLLLDEPTAGLAPELVTATLREVRRVAADVPVLLVEQNARRAVEAADRVLVLQEGRVAFAGTPAQLAARSELADAILGERVVDPTAKGRT